MGAQSSDMKEELLKALHKCLKLELQRAIKASRVAREGSIHGDAVAKSKYETGATELAYLADGQAKRAADLSTQLKTLEEMLELDYGPREFVVVGSLVEIENGSAGIDRYLILPIGAGTVIEVGGEQTKVISPSSPLGSRIIGSYVGDEVATGQMITLIRLY